jgi:hypothetical protein
MRSDLVYHQFYPLYEDDRYLCMYYKLNLFLLNTSLRFQVFRYPSDKVSGLIAMAYHHLFNSI